MAEKRDKLQSNVTGPYYVDGQCIYCGLCVEHAPSNFQKLCGEQVAVVIKQPINQKEKNACDYVVHWCPYNAIGSDGDEI